MSDRLGRALQKTGGQMMNGLVPILMQIKQQQEEQKQQNFLNQMAMNIDTRAADQLQMNKDEAQTNFAQSFYDKMRLNQPQDNFQREEANKATMFDLDKRLKEAEIAKSTAVSPAKETDKMKNYKPNSLSPEVAKKKQKFLSWQNELDNYGNPNPERKMVTYNEWLQRYDRSVSPTPVSMSPQERYDKSPAAKVGIPYGSGQGGAEAQALQAELQALLEELQGL